MLKNWTEYSSSYAIVGSSLFFLLLLLSRLILNARFFLRLGENIVVRRFERLTLGEGLEKKD